MQLSRKEGGTHYWKSRLEGSTPLGDRIKKERTRRNMSIDLFAERCEISVSSLTGIENRGVDPRISSIIRMCKVLDCTADWLLGLEG